MYTEKYIQKAIDGGYEPVNTSPYKWKMLYHRFLLDPEFWKCLGKAMGWKDVDTHSQNDPDGWGRFVTHFKPWLVKWHSFIDHLANGGSIEDFFKSLEK